VQHERIGISAQLGHDEGRPVGHETGDEMDVAAQPVELGADDWRLDFAGALDRCVKLRSVIVGAALGLGEGLDRLERLGLGKPGRSLPAAPRGRAWGAPAAPPPRWP
jgi:hypothetical protein